MRTNRRNLLNLSFTVVSSLFLSSMYRTVALAEGFRKLRIASVKFGSLSWLLETIKAEGLDKKYGLTIEIVETATNASTPVALYGGNADIVVTDWPWVLRQRAMGEKLRFSPFSASLGAVMVANSSSIHALSDLKGKKLGVAGTATDKSWLLIRAFSRSKLGGDLADWVTPQFGSAPLLNEQLRSSKIDGVLNFWTYTARLEAQGYRKVISMADVLSELGVYPQPALVGFVWNERLETEMLEAIRGFLLSVQDANKLLLETNGPWKRLQDQMKVTDENEFQLLIKAYRSGVRGYWTNTDMQAAEKIFAILNTLEKEELVGKELPFDTKAFYVPRT
ncbi:MAG: ABC transporter substrate-binding protein [Hyphomicrobium sp.]